MSQVSFRGGDAITRQRRDFGGVFSVRGRRDIHSIQVTIPGIAVGQAAYPMMFQSYSDGSDLHMRIIYPDVLVANSFNNAQVQLLGSNGSATFSDHGRHVDFTGHGIEPGYAIKTANNQLWSIVSVRSAQDITVSGTHSSYGPGTYSVVKPGITTNAIVGTITSFNQINADRDNVVGMAITFLPKQPVGALQIWGSN